MSQSVKFARMVTSLVVMTVVAVMLQDQFNKVVESSAFEPTVSRQVETASNLFPVVFLVLFAALLVGVVTSVSDGDISIPSVPSRGDLPTIPRLTIAMPYPFPTTGVKHTVDITALDRSDGDCVICGEPADGELRRWRKDLVVLGLPLWSFEAGANHYCESCTDPFSVQAISEEAEIKLDAAPTDGGDAE